MNTIVDSSSLWKNRAAYDYMQQRYDRILTQIKIPYETRYLDTRHGKTYVVLAGNPQNPPLIFWHGMSASATMWINEINAFADDYYVIAPDIPGETGRSAPNRMQRKSAQHGEWAVDVLNMLNIDVAYHAGLSGGGWMILKLATIAPEKIKAAVLMSSGGVIPVNRMLALKLIPHFLVAPFIGVRAFAKRFVRIQAPPNYDVTQEDIEMFELISQFKSEMGVPPFSDAELAMLQAPTLLLMGQYEAVFSPIEKLIARAQAHLPNLIRADVLPDVGHAMNGENPALIHRKIRTFFENYQ